MSEDGEVIPGTVPGPDDVDSITLELLAGERIQLSAESDDFDTIITLFDPDGNEVARDDDGGDGFNSLLDYSVEATGQHVAEVSSFLDGTGDFTLTLTFPDGALNVDDEFTEVNAITSGDGVVSYDSDLLAGEQIIVTVDATAGSDLDPRITIFDPSGNEIGTDDDGGDGFNSLLSIEDVPESGTYVTEVDSFGTTTGEFEITISIIAN